MFEDIFDDLGLGRFNKRYDRHALPTLGADHGINFINPLDEHGPGLAASSGWRT
jgi:hypothetical protein